MANICPLCANETGYGSCVPRHLHAQSGAQETKDKSTDSAPAERQELGLVPCIEVIVLPRSFAEQKVFLCDDCDMDDSPVSDDGKECLQSIVEVCCSTRADYYRCDEAECYEDYSRNPQSPWTKVLCMKSEGVVVRYVVLVTLVRAPSMFGRLTGIELSPANTSKNFPKPPAGARAIFSGPPTP